MPWNGRYLTWLGFEIYIVHEYRDNGETRERGRVSEVLDIY